MNKQIEKVISIANAEVGYKEEKTNITKYAKDFDTKYPDFYNTKKQGVAWCDMFVDWLFVTAFGEDQALKMLCQPKKSAGAGCKFSAGYFKAKKQFYNIPEVGDQIFFYDSKGEINHTGIVYKVEDGYVFTVEGNSSDEVKKHRYQISNKKIAGYGRPEWKEEASTIADTAPVKPSTTLTTSQKPQNTSLKSEEEVAKEVVAGKWGNGKERQKRLSEAGYDYNAVQKIVNQLVAKKTPAKTFIGIVNTVQYSLNVRIGAGTQYRIIKTLPKGSKVELFTDKTNGWYKLADGSGYVAGNLIKR